MDKLIANMKAKMEAKIERTEGDLARIRAGRATPALLDGINVDYYGTDTPINQAATIAVPEPRFLTITPWDKTRTGPAREIAKHTADWIERWNKEIGH